MNTKHNVLTENLARYLKANKEEKGRMLDEWGQLLLMHRKSIIRFLKREQMKDPVAQSKRRGVREQYGGAVTVAFKEIWEISSELCGERLHPVVAEYVRILQRDKMWQHNQTNTKLLLKMSVSTIKRRIAKFRTYKRKQRQNTTKAAKLITQIPLRTGPWIDPEPGNGEIDTVVHCGDTLAGDMGYTVNYTDICTTWTVSAAQLNKGERATVTSIEAMQERLPFTLKGLDPDNGSEFINWHLKNWCDKENIELTRSRPYKKNDNAHIEQKNGSIIRNFLGYRRIDTPEQIKLLNQLYAGPLYFYINFFQPSMKCLEKKRVGSKYRRIYDQPKTPYERILNLDSIPQATKDELTVLYNTLNPLLLKQKIDTLIKKIFSKK